MAPKPGSKEWLDGFVKSLQKDNAAKSSAVTPAFSLPYMTSEAFDNITKPQNYAPTEGVVSRTFDILLRPLYGASQAVGSLASNFVEEKEDIESNPFKALWEGVSGKNKDTYVEQFDKLGMNSGAAAAVGAVANFVFDPTNLLFGSLGAKALRTAKGATKAGKTARRIEDFEDFVEEAVRASNEANVAREAGIKSQAQDLADKKWARQQAQMRSDIRPAQDAFADLKFEAQHVEVSDILNRLKEPTKPHQKTYLLTRLKNLIPEADYDILKASTSTPARFRSKVDGLLESRYYNTTEKVTDIPTTSTTSTASTTASGSTVEARQARIDAVSRRLDDLERQSDEIIAYGNKHGYTKADIQEVSKLSSSGAVLHGNSEVAGELFKHTMAAKKISEARSGKDVLPMMHTDMVNSVREAQNSILRDNPAAEFWIKSQEPGAIEHAITPADIVDTISPEIMRELGIKYTTAVPMENITEMVARTADLAEATSLSSLRKIDPELSAKASDLMRSEYSTGADGMVRGSYGLDELEAVQNVVRDSIEQAGLRRHLATEGNKFRKQSTIRNSVAKLAEYLEGIRTDIADVARGNAAIYEAREALAGRVIADKAVKQFDNALSEGNVAEAVKNVNNPERLVSELPKDSDAGFIAKEALGEHVAQVTNEFDTATARSVQQNIRQYAQRNLDQAAKNIRDRNGYKTYSQIRKEAEDFVRSNYKIEPSEFPTLRELEIQMSVNRKRNILSGLVKSFGSDSGQFAILYANRMSAASYTTKAFEESLHKVFKQSTREDIGKVIRAFQKEGGVVNLSPQLRTLAEEIKTDLDLMLGLEDGLLGSIARNGIRIEDFEAELTRRGFHNNLFPVDEIELAKIKDPVERARYIFNGWKRYDFENPIKELSQINEAILNTLSNQAIGQSMSEFGVTELAARGLRDQGVKMVRLPDNISTLENTRYIQHIPRKNSTGEPLLYPKDYVDQLVNLERELNLSSSWSSDSKFGKFVNNVVNPFYASWKPLVTIMRPGHNIRNAFSDLYLNYMAGIRTATPYKKAYSALDSLGILPAPMDKAFKTVIGNTKHDTIKIKVGRKTEEVPISRIAEWAEQDGMIVTFRAQEDIIEATASGNILERAGKKVQMFGPVKWGAYWSEADTWLFRTTQYIHELEKGKFKSIKAARLHASDRARKFHPDVIGLTPEAKKYARLAMPFYSWFRQILPVVAETTLTKPARMTALNKMLWGVEYGFFNEDAQNANISNPFPIARNIPEFLQGNSYAGGSFVFNLGTPPEAARDIADHDFRRSMLGMINPLAKIPIEAITGKSLGTGAEIKDASEYIDQQIPVVSNLSSISGTSVTGTLANWIQGENTKYKGERTFAGRQEITAPFGTDPQRSVRMGEKQRFLNTSLYNFFTGVGMQDTDRPSLAWYASQDRFNRSR